MKKRIFTFLTLLVAFFGLIGLTTNNYKVINAADSITTVDSDLASITVPETAIISFPVPYESVHGNKINWTVQEKQTIIEYDNEAHWMVVNRPETGSDQTIIITVTVGESENAKSKDFEVKVPAGKTAAPIYTITYIDGEETLKKETYKLGEKTKNLENLPNKEGYTFGGWYENDVKVEKILVGSNRNYTLVAKWNKNATPLTEVNVAISSSQEEYDGQKQEPVVTLTYENNQLEKGTHYQVTYTKDGQTVEEIKNVGEYKVVVTAIESAGYTGTKEFTFEVTKKQYTLTPSTKTIYEGQTLPTWSIDDFTSTGLVEGDTVSVSGNINATYNPESPTNAGTYEVSFEGLTIDNENYELVIEKGSLVITKTNITLELSQASFEYTGEEIKPTVTVKDGETTLEADTHYTVEYANNTNKGTATVTVTFKDKYEGVAAVSENFEITAKKVTLTANDVTYTYGDTPVANGYTGELTETEITSLNPQVSIQDNETVITITEDSNYDVTLVNGTVTMEKRAITVKADDLTSIYGSVLSELTFKVTNYQISETDLAELKELLILTKAEGNDAKEYVISVAYKEDAESTKFNITFENGTYTIEQLDLSNLVEVEVLGTDFNIQTSHNTPKVKVTYNNEELNSDNYDLTYENNTVVGTAQAVVTFKGNYKGSASASFVLTETGKAGEIAAELNAYYADKLTGTISTVPALQVEFDDENVKVQWTPSILGVLEIDQYGVVTVHHPEHEDAKITLTAMIQYSDTSADKLEYTFYIPAKVNVDFGTNENEYTFTSTDTTDDPNYIIEENSNEVVIAEYEITVLQGENEVSNPGEVSVKILIPEEYRDLQTLTVYHIKDAETKEVVSNVVREGNYLVFTATNFSPYVIVYTLPEIATTASDVYAMLKADKEEITLGSDINVDTLLIDGKTVTLNLGEYTIKASDKDLDGSAYGLYAINGAAVTINATTGGIDAGEGADWNIPLRASKGSTINVNGGNYVTGPNSDDSGNSGMFVSDTSTINIYDGKFETEKDYLGFYYLFNIKEADKETAHINVYGGTFINADPRNSNVRTNLVQEGSSVEKTTIDGKTAYVVAKATFTVTFLDKDGKLIEEQTVKYNESATAPEAPKVEGYTFKEWDTTFDNVTTALEVKAVYTINTYTVTFNTDGGSEVANITGNYNTEVEAPESPTKDNYIFDGWKDAEGNDFTFPHTLVGDVELTAKWKQASSSGESYFVKVTENQTNWSGTYLIVCETNSVAFDGSLETLDAVSNYKSVSISDGKIRATEDMMAIIFVFEGSGNGYTIKSKFGQYIYHTSDANGLTSSAISGHTNSLSINSDGSINIIGSGGAYLRFNSASNQLRFRFYKSSTYTDQKAITLYRLSDDSSQTPEQSETPTEYALTLNLNSGLLEDAPSKYVVADGLKLPTPTREGHEFLGWFDNAELTGEAVAEIAAGSKGDKELWAKWEEDTNTDNEGGNKGEKTETTTSITFSNLYNADATIAGTSIDIDLNTSVKFDKSSGSTPPKYYNKGTSIRVYGQNTMTISATNKIITKITITFGSSDGSNAITADTGSYSNGTWTGSSSSVVFTIGGTSGNRRIASITVVYQDN